MSGLMNVRGVVIAVRNSLCFSFLHIVKQRLLMSFYSFVIASQQDHLSLRGQP